MSPYHATFTPEQLRRMFEAYDHVRGSSAIDPDVIALRIIAAARGGADTVDDLVRAATLKADGAARAPVEDGACRRK